MVCLTPKLLASPQLQHGQSHLLAHVHMGAHDEPFEMFAGIMGQCAVLVAPLGSSALSTAIQQGSLAAHWSHQKHATRHSCLLPGKRQRYSLLHDRASESHATPMKRTSAKLYSFGRRTLKATPRHCSPSKTNKLAASAMVRSSTNAKRCSGFT